MTDKIVESILEIRNSGKYNMFDVKGVQWEANERGFYDLVIFLEEHKDKYVKFILTGERDPEPELSAVAENIPVQG